MIAEDAEISIEANPGTVSIPWLIAVKSLGFNRISLGVQSCQDGHLEEMGRIHRHKDTVEAVEMLIHAGFTNINMDLMFGLPGQTKEEWMETMDYVLSTPVTHLSCYSLKLEEGTVWGDRYNNGSMKEPDDELDRWMYHYAIRRLSSDGFHHYEISNFSKKGFECRHNCMYWLCDDYLGVGSAAHSLMNGQRFGNVPDITDYICKISQGIQPWSESASLTKADEAAERLMLGFRLIEGVDVDKIETITHEPVKKIWGETLEDLCSRGLLEVIDGKYSLSVHGLDFANQVFMAFVD